MGGIRVRRAWLVAVLTVAVVATQMPVSLFPLLADHVPSVAIAAETLDQSTPAAGIAFDLIGGDANPASRGQTVTAGLTGPLTGVRLPIGCPTGGILTLEIQTVTGTGVPSGLVLTAQAYPTIADDVALKDFVFSDPASFNRGDRFAIVARELSSDDSRRCRWQQANGDTYPGGNRVLRFGTGAWDGVSGDYGFETYVGAAAAGATGRIYVSNSDSGTVSAIDPATNTVIATITVGSSPYGVAATPNGQRVWVSNWLAGTLNIIDTATNAIEDGAAISGNPHGIAFNPAGDRAYVAVDNMPVSPTSGVWIFDTTVSPPYPMAVVPVGAFPTGVTMRPDGRRLYVANYGQDLGTTVSVIDTDPLSLTENNVVATITVGTGPFQVGVSPDNTRAYVTNFTSGTVSVINTATNAVTATISVGTNPTFVAVNPAGTRAYVTNIGSNSVSIIDTATNTVASTITPVGGQPRGIALSPSGSRAYVASSGDNSVHVLAADGTGVATVPVGSGPFYVAVVPVTSLLSGIARCNNGDGTTLLPGATVDLYSGSALVASTTAGQQTAAYSFNGVAPNSTYTLHFRKVFFSEVGTSYTISCATSVTTDANGNATGGAGTYIPNRHNHIWPTAYPLVSGIPITDYLFRSGQSAWFKVPIGPGKRVSVKITNLPANYSLALYKDIRQLYDQQIAALNADPLNAVLNLDASVAPDALSPDELSPDALSPDELSPDALSPDELSPDELSPDELSPDELSPDELSPDALSPDELSPDELSPDELSPDELSADAYAAAQTAALIGVSAHVGLSPEQIARNTWDNTGFFYIRVRGHNGAYDASTPFTIQATVTDVSCTGVDLTDHPSTVTATSGKQTVILTNSSRLVGDASAKAAFMTKLTNFALRADVKGAVVDLASIPEAANAYTIWDTLAGQACPAAANVVARRAKDVIAAYRALNPTLTYVVIVGNDHVIPFYRQPDQSGLGSEKDYRPAVLDTTASQASLRLGYVLTQDFYGSTRAISRFDHQLYLPDLAVGRLVESISDMSAVVDAYVGTNGAVAPTRALVTGYDFLSDTAGFIADQLTANSLTVDRQLIQPVGATSTDPTAWTGDQLKAKLFGATTYGILSLNAHFSASTMLAADFATRVMTTDVTALALSDTRFRNALVLSTGCHSAYNTVDPDATALTQPVDWTQAFAARGATVIGGTGYQYGDTDFMKYSEQILGNTTLQLRYGAGPVAIGMALANAKRAYVSSLTSLGGIDEKALAEATLYGLPMLGYNLPAGTRLTPPTISTAGLLTQLTPSLSLGTLTPSYTLHRNTRTLDVLGGGTETAIYYDIDGNVAVKPEAPVLPSFTLGVGATARAVRGAVLFSANYVDEAGVTPFTDVATTEVRGAHPRYVTDVFTPVRPFDLNQFAGQNLVSTPFQFRSTNGGTTGVARRLTSESFRLYYFDPTAAATTAAALAAAPVVYNVTLTPNAANDTLVDVAVTVGGLSVVGVQEVFVTYTAEGTGSLHGHWASLQLIPGAQTSLPSGAGFARQYAGSIPRESSSTEDVRAIVQAVGGNGLVTWASNDGAYYQVIDETATAADPKASTALTLVTPASGTYRSTVDVIATLTSNGAGLGGQPVSFRSGGVRVNAMTDANGVAKAQLMLASAPGIATVSVGFSEDQSFLGSGAQTTIDVLRAPSTFTALDTAPLPVGGSVLIATLRGGTEPLGGQLVTLTGGGKTAQTFTDGYGRVRLDTADGFPSGAYSVLVTFDGNDRYLPATAVSVLIVVYDPTTFVTGGGWITIPAGSPGLVPGKKTNFGVNMKYKNGTIIPTGSVEFQAKESNVAFKATSIDWLAISGNHAEAQGHGTVNGVAGWTFRVVMVDGPDRFEIRIWHDGADLSTTPVYGAAANIGGGNVVVH